MSHTFFFYTFIKPEVSFRHRLVWSLAVQGVLYGEPYTNRHICQLTGINQSATLPSLVTELVDWGLVRLENKRLSPQSPPADWVRPRSPTGDEMFNTIHFNEVRLHPRLPPVAAVCLGILTNMQRRRRNTYIGTLAGIAGCHPNTVSTHLVGLESLGLLTYTQQVRGPLTYMVPDRPDFWKEDKPRPEPLKKAQPKPEPVDDDELQRTLDRNRKHVFFAEDTIRQLWSGGMRGPMFRTYAALVSIDVDHVGFLPDTMIPTKVARRLISEARAEHAQHSRTNPGEWWRLFHYKAKKWLVETGHYTFEGDFWKPIMG